MKRITGSYTFQKKMSIKGKVRFLPTKNMYVFSENEISTPEIESETKFPKKVHKNYFFKKLTLNMFVECNSTIYLWKILSFYWNM